MTSELALVGAPLVSRFADPVKSPGHARPCSTRLCDVRPRAHKPPLPPERARMLLATIGRCSTGCVAQGGPRLIPAVAPVRIVLLTMDTLTGGPGMPPAAMNTAKYPYVALMNTFDSMVTS